MNRKFLTDVEILGWNNKLSKIRIKSYDDPISILLKPNYGNRQTLPELVILVKRGVGGFYQLEEIEEIEDPIIKFTFSFSVSENRKDQFFEILDRLFKDDFVTKLNFKGSLLDIKVSDKSIESIIEYKHEVYQKKYIRYTYNFFGKLSSIIGYISYLTDSIEYFQMIWGYDKDGKEHCLLDYPIGSIVSTPEDKSKDYLVVGYEYQKNTNNIYNIYFTCCEMLNTDSLIIKYGDTIRYTGDKLCHSRNNRINNILN